MFLTFSESLKHVLINMVATMMMSAESASPGLLKMKVFLNTVHDIIISVNIVNSKTLSCESSYTVDMVM